MMRGQLIAVLFTTACVVDPSGDVSTQTQALIGGTTAHTATFKTIAGIEDGTGWFCSGVLVDSTHILTAAHCFIGNTAAATTMKVRFDSDNLNNGGGKTVAVAALAFDPGFDGVNWGHDAAIMTLASPVTDRTPSTILRTAIANGTTLTKLGYGASNTSGNGTGTLRQAQSTTVDCGATGDSSLQGKPTLMCFNASSAASCGGDDGGPAIDGTGNVAGIESAGTGQQCNQGVDLYTSVYGELAWIDSVITPTGTGGGGGDPDPTQPTQPTDPTAPPTGTDPSGTMVGGCSTGSGSTGSLALIAIAGLLAARRRR